MAKPTIRYGKETPTRLQFDSIDWCAYVIPGDEPRINVNTLNKSELVSVMIRHCGADYTAACQLDDAAKVHAIHGFAKEQDQGRDWTSDMFTPKGSRDGGKPRADVRIDPPVDAPAPVPAPVVTPAPVAPVPAAGASSLDAVIGAVAQQAARDVVTAALAGFNPVSDETIGAKVDAAVEPALDALATLADSVPAMIDAAVDKLRPTIVQLPGRPDVTIEGRTHAKFAEVLAYLNAGVTPFLVGPAGTGKTYLARQAADALGVRCIVISCHPMMTRAEMIGYMAPGTNEHNVGPLGEAWQEADGAVLVFDEIDAAHPAALVTLNDCLAATAGTTIRLADGTMAPRPERLFIIATANTFGTGPNAQYVGRNALDAATLDRFATVEIDYDRDTERELVGPYLNGSSAKWLDAVETMRSNAESGAIRTVVSTRGVVDVAKLVHAGIPVDQAVTSRIAKGLGADQTRKLMDGVTLAGIVGWES